MAKITYETVKKDDIKDKARVARAVEDRSLVGKIDEIIANGMIAGVTDIHFEPYPDVMKVRHRDGGQLQDAGEFSAASATTIINRLKVIGGMDITRNRIAQRGFFKVENEGVAAGCNAVIFPSNLGEKVTVDILYRRAMEMSLEHLGFFPRELALFSSRMTAAYRSRPNRCNVRSAVNRVSESSLLLYTMEIGSKA